MAVPPDSTVACQHSVINADRNNIQPEEDSQVVIT